MIGGYSLADGVEFAVASASAEWPSGALEMTHEFTSSTSIIERARGNIVTAVCGFGSSRGRIVVPSEELVLVMASDSKHSALLSLTGFSIADLASIRREGMGNIHCAGFETYADFCAQIRAAYLDVTGYDRVTFLEFDPMKSSFH